MLIETDFLISLVRENDRHHIRTLKILEKLRGHIKLSPYTLTELDLLVWSNTFKVKDKELFFKLLEETLNYYTIETLKPKFTHIAKAYELREKYSLSFFDSLHAAVANIENIPLMSYDKTYSKIKEIKHVNPLTLA